MHFTITRAKSNLIHILYIIIHNSFTNINGFVFLKVLLEISFYGHFYALLQATFVFLYRIVDDN